ncbi:TIGR03618 family F420-dependent PPOX class oxidoreductase [Nocardioides deserti]|uniref:TIGR03618 family F420-dependent PPOX class oxidoreductase n=1 Tax=Nocardioides deserti TaxID=1588644 RepID=A0ABR6U3M7_9ACTN|nr:TIGR03618 family F420-dependent PPOX class oxidoreductase [Nocardioides deserti]MBC2958985.1 TIGR03618 family F420-dependent PPOX class oxidoreductase [Nocardioides deserti]GGO69062.1 PPOX class F420-dependent enzyme [Nocardioides deserti]
MANQRSQVVMSDDEVDTFLTQQRSSTVATVGPNGQVHLVAMWYAWLDGHIWLETKAKSQKVVNLRRDPRMSFLVEAGHTYDQLRGVSLEGNGVVIEDEQTVWDVCVNVFERYNAPYTEELKPFVELMAKNRVVVRLDVDRVRSWDHRKLGMDPLDLGGSTAEFLD